MRVIRAVSILAVLLLLAANAFALAPQGDAYRAYLPWAGLALGLLVLILLLVLRIPTLAHATAQAALPTRAHAPANQAEAEIVSFIAMLQDKGRLVDFLMDDINAYDDAQVGAAARFVHAGCKSALLEHFQIRPVREESEGSRVRIEAGYPADEYRLLGTISGSAPFVGTLVHHGWKTESVKLPHLLSSPGRLPAIAPAEVELV
ncbi:MAG TPA: DUF2760 domain-containing protein [Acetobacteraceae bacterium]|nr:DUF2760 domain-containing protein [Acetobacteraceae bacterium]